jgi:hypothetical protein
MMRSVYTSDEMMFPANDLHDFVDGTGSIKYSQPKLSAREN